LKAAGIDAATTPRAKALVDKATRVAGQNDEKTCAETIKGLRQVAGKTE
jgi:hypothetical protein